MGIDIGFESESLAKCSVALCSSLRVAPDWGISPTGDALGDMCCPCPLRPLDHWWCYNRFGSYPSMNSFRLGLAGIIAGTRDTDERMAAPPDDAHPFAFYSERVALDMAQVPSFWEGHQRLVGYYSEQSEQHKISAEGGYGAMREMLSNILPEGTEIHGGEPLVVPEHDYTADIETLLSGLLYRPDPYDPASEEIPLVLPLLYLYELTGEGLIWRQPECMSPTIRRSILSCLDRLRLLTQALQTGWQHGLRVFVSY